uniref:Uncharacterized protein n=1 Tax=Anopheles farauti TaxID=69004 RepID=A0A182QYX9_9DIPT
MSITKMESNYVSVFKLDGVPILPPLITDEVRAAVADYRQKALGVEKRLEERRRLLMQNNIATQPIDCHLNDSDQQQQVKEDQQLNALTAHEQRMKELLQRQEEERLLLERSFREKTQELVALCAKTLAVTDSDVPRNGGEQISATCKTNRMKTPDLNPASSVSQLSLCDMSYDSCTEDTDDAAYQTCHANGTSEENGTNNESTLVEEDSAIAFSGNNPMETFAKNTMLSIKRYNDALNGNGQFDTLSQRMMELQQYRAATIINAYVRGYLTRRLFQTNEVQCIKRTIVDIVCLIVSWHTDALRGYKRYKICSSQRNHSDWGKFVLETSNCGPGLQAEENYIRAE